jgi:hypothetical protein
MIISTQHDAIRNTKKICKTTWQRNKTKELYRLICNQRSLSPIWELPVKAKNAPQLSWNLTQLLPFGLFFLVWITDSNITASLPCEQ